MDQFVFLIGAPKCGTSSLFRQLAMHESIIPSNPKETYALLPESHPVARSRKINGLEELKSHFGKCRQDQQCPTQLEPVYLEGTTHHYSSDHAARQIESVRNQSHVVLLLRHPAKRILSSFQYTQNNLARIPESYTFRDYVDHLLNGKENEILRRIKHPVSGPILANELALSSYSDHLTRWFDHVGKDKIRVEAAEEFFADPTEMLKSIWSWIGLEVKQIDPTALQRENHTRQIGSKKLHQIAQKINTLIPRSKLAYPVKQAYFWIQRRFGKPVEKTNHMEEITRLEDYFSNDVAKLESMLNRKFDCWSIR